MNDFAYLIREWNELMGRSSYGHASDSTCITIEQEQHVLELTARYIHRLEAIQSHADKRGSDFAERLVLSLEPEYDYTERILEICQRLLSSVGMTFRGEIPREIPRAKRLASRQFVIDWSNGDLVGAWPELEVTFPIRDAVEYCAEHMAGADEAILETLVLQYLRELRQGTMEIPRMTLESKGENTLTYRWEDASVSLDRDSTETIPTNKLQETKAPILVFLEDELRDAEGRAQSFMVQLHKDLYVEVSQIIDEIELNEEIVEQVESFVSKAVDFGGVEPALILNEMRNPAYYGAIEAIGLQNSEALHQCAGVFKAVNRLRKSPRIVTDLA
jgi:hypothetical protein